MTHSSSRKIGLHAGAVSAALMVLALTPASAVSGAPSLPAEVRQLQVFAGAWRGQLQLSEPGKPSQMLKFAFDCRTVEAAWAVTCTGTESNSEMTITEADVIGYEPNEQLVHFFTVDNQGETHDHKGRWTDAQTLALEHTGLLEGKPLSEKLTLVFHGTRELTAEFVGSVDGKEAYRGKIQARK
jgi:hypothetical protein